MLAAHWFNLAPHSFYALIGFSTPQFGTSDAVGGGVHFIALRGRITAFTLNKAGTQQAVSHNGFPEASENPFSSTLSLVEEMTLAR